jgi:acyl-CoA synthetase (AMP-forming)/AMP-acid ligase II
VNAIPIDSTRHECLHDLIRKQNPDAIALLAPGRKPLNYGRLNQQMNSIVTKLNMLCIGRNDRVAMVLPEGPEMAAAFLSIAAGATCAPLNPAYRAREFESHLKDLNAKAMIVSSGSRSPAVDVARAAGIPVLQLVVLEDAEAGLFLLEGTTVSRPIQGGFAQHDDVAIALHTSGTTSRPKLVPLTHYNVCISAQNIRDVVQLAKNDRCLNVMPLFHIHGLSALVASLVAGASVVCTSGFSVSGFFELHRTRPGIRPNIRGSAYCVGKKTRRDLGSGVGSRANRDQ